MPARSTAIEGPVEVTPPSRTQNEEDIEQLEEANLHLMRHCREMEDQFEEMRLTLGVSGRCSLNEPVAGCR